MPLARHVSVSNMNKKKSSTMFITIGYVIGFININVKIKDEI